MSPTSYRTAPPRISEVQYTQTLRGMQAWARLPSAAETTYHPGQTWNGEVNSVWYVILGKDAPDSLEKRLAARPAHLQRLQALSEEGRLLLAGPLPAVDAEDPGPAGYLGSVVVAEFDSLEAARAWAEEDPYLREGVFRSLEVHPFRRVLP